MLFCIREHSHKEWDAAPGAFWLSPPGYRVATAVFSASPAPPLVRGWCWRPWRIHMGLTSTGAHSPAWAVGSCSAQPPVLLRAGNPWAGVCAISSLLCLSFCLHLYFVFFSPYCFALVSFLAACPSYSFFHVFSVLLVPTPQISLCSPPSQHQSPLPASGASSLPPPHARAVPSPPAVPELTRKSSLRCPGRGSEPPQLLHRHSASELPTVPGSSPPACPSHRPVMPSIRRTSLSPPPLQPSHFPFASRQPLRRSSLCISPWTSAAPVTNAPLGQRGDALQPHSPTILPVIPAPCDRVREPTGKAGQEGLAGVPLNGHPKEQMASGSPRTQLRSVPGSFFPRLGAAPSSQLPVIASPPGSFGQAPSLSSPPSPRPPQQWCQPMSHCLPLPPPYAAGSEVNMPGRTPPYMTSSTISHLSKY